MKKYCSILIIALITFSCKEKCEIQPIDKSVLDINQVKGDFIIKNQNEKIDSLILIDFAEDLVTEKITSPMRHDECGHFLFYRYTFKKETLDFSLEKNKIEYVFDFIGGFCDTKEKNISFDQIMKNTIIRFDFEKCEKSELKTIVLKKFVIDHIITQNGDIWKPIKFIPRELKK